MRHARLKPASQDTWHHCYNRAVGNRNDRPFDRVGDAADYRFCSYGLRALAAERPAPLRRRPRGASDSLAARPVPDDVAAGDQEGDGQIHGWLRHRGVNTPSRPDPNAVRSRAAA